MSTVNLGSIVVDIGGGNGGGSTPTEIALLSVTTAPSGSFAVGSKYYNSSTKKIVTAVTADTWVGATSADAVFGVIYFYDNSSDDKYYIWDGDNLVVTDLERYQIKNISNNYNETSEDTYPSSYALSAGLATKEPTLATASNTVAGKIRIATDGEVATGTLENVGVNPKQLKEGLASVGSSSIVPFSVKSSNTDSNGLTDLVSMNGIINEGCSITSGVAIGGANKYLQLTKTAPLGSADSWEIKTKYYYNGGNTFPTIFGNSGKDNQVPMLYTDTNVLKLFMSSNGTSWDLFSESMLLTLTTETTYWFKLSFDSVNGYKLEYSTDGTNYTTSWSSATITKCFSGQPFMLINNAYNVTSYYSAGSIDLNETVITIDSEIWWDYSGDTIDTISFKIDDGTLYAPLTIVSADGTETTLTTVSDLDLSSFADGRINIFFGASGAVAYINTIFNQPNEPTPNATNDIWFNNLNEAKKWSGSAWETTDLVFGLYIIKNVFLETYGNVPVNYNGIGEKLFKSYISDFMCYDIYCRAGFKFYGKISGRIVIASGSYYTNYYTLPFVMFDTNYIILNSNNKFGGDIPGIYPVTRVFFAISYYTTPVNIYYKIEGYVAK